MNNKFFKQSFNSGEQENEVKGEPVFDNKEISTGGQRSFSFVQPPVINNFEANEVTQTGGDINNQTNYIEQGVGKENVVENLNEGQNKTVNNNAVAETFVATTVKKEDVEKSNIEVLDNNEKLDPLNNANNPIPVNPVAPVVAEEKIEDVDVKPIILLNLLFDLIKKPGTTLTKYVSKYQGTKTAFFITMFITVFSLVLSLVMSLITGGFIKNYNVTTGSYTTSYSFSNIFTQDFLRIIAIALMISGGLILIVSIVYYAASFFNSKGVNFGKCLMICNVCFLPLIIGVTALYSLGVIISYYVGFIFLGISIIYSTILFITGMNECLKIESLDKKIYYNLFNLVIVFLIVVAIVFIFFYGEISFIPTNVSI